MKDPLGVIPSKGNREPHKVKKKILLTSLGDGRVTVDSNPEVVSSILTEVKIFFLCLVWFPDSLY